MLKRYLYRGIAAGCLLMWGQMGAAETTSVRTVDAVVGSSTSNWVQPLRLANSRGTDSEIRQVAFLGIDEELGEPWTIASLMGDDAPFTVGGWFQVGYHNRSDGVFNTYPHHAQLHQGWLYAERETDGSNGFDIGGRVDLMYGTDGPNTQAFGNTPGVFDFSDTFTHGEYGWAIPQLYAEVAYHDWKVKAGHFYTLLGWEVVPATGNFFYSHAFTMNFSEAFTHTGAVATYSGIENVELYGGYTLGWDTGFDQFDGGSSFLGGFKVSPVEDIDFIYISTIGNLGWVGKGYSHSVVIDFSLTEKLNYIVQSDYVTTTDSEVLGVDYDTIGLNNYLIYWATDRVGFGTRAEWWKANGVSYYECTAGINFKPIPNFTLRPEIRYQWAPAAQGPGGVNPIGIPNLEKGIFGIDGILTF